MLFLCLTIRSTTWANFPYIGRLDCHKARDILGIVHYSLITGWRVYMTSYDTSLANAFRGLAHFCRWAGGILHDPLFTALSVGCPGRRTPNCHRAFKDIMPRPTMFPSGPLGNSANKSSNMFKMFLRASNYIPLTLNLFMLFERNDIA